MLGEIAAGLGAITGFFGSQQARRDARHSRAQQNRLFELEYPLLQERQRRALEALQLYQGLVNEARAEMYQDPAADPRFRQALTAENEGLARNFQQAQGYLAQRTAAQGGNPQQLYAQAALGTLAGQQAGAQAQAHGRYQNNLMNERNRRRSVFHGLVGQTAGFDPSGALAQAGAQAGQRSAYYGAQADEGLAGVFGLLGNYAESRRRRRPWWEDMGGESHPGYVEVDRYGPRR